MSDAIIAKALNSTIGTENFVGLDEILDSHLNKLDVILRQHAEDTKEALDSLYNISNPVFSANSADPVIAIIPINVQEGNSDLVYSKYLVLPYGGYLIYEYDGYESDYLSIEGDGIICEYRNTITFSKNAKIRFRAQKSETAGADASVKLRGRTEYAPEITYTIE